MKLSRHIPTLLDNLIWIVLLVVVIFFSVVTDGFLDTGSFMNILVHSAVLGLLAVSYTHLTLPTILLV